MNNLFRDVLVNFGECLRVFLEWAQKYAPGGKDENALYAKEDGDSCRDEEDMTKQHVYQDI